MSSFLTGVKALILESGLGKARKEILTTQLCKNGGESLSLDKLPSEDEPYFVLVGDAVTEKRACRLLGKEDLPCGAVLVRADWLSQCLASARCIDHRRFSLQSVSSKNERVEHKEGRLSLASPLPGSNAAINGEPTKSGDRQEWPQVLGVTTEDGVRAVTPDSCDSPDRKTVDSGWASGSPVNSPEKKVTITAQVVGHGFVGRSWGKKRKAHDLLWLDADSDESSGEDKSVDKSEFEASQAAACQWKEYRPGRKKKLSGFMCETPSTQATNHNQQITDKLQEMMKVYETSSVTNPKDTFRALSYRKAITALRSHPKPIKTREEALAINGIGKRMADKVIEIIESGHLRRLDHIDPKHHVIALFTGIWGVGPSTAEKWYSEGLRTLNDVRTKATLNRQQMVGLTLYDDLKERMKRDEVAEIEAVVRDTALKLCPGLEVITCGSYRRGKPTCGDVDILITHPDGRSHSNIFSPLLKALHEIEFLTHDLVASEHAGEQQKYLGVCRLSEGHKHRRLDIIVVPYKELPCALLYFTGSGLFNRSMRCRARKMNMSLSEHSLNAGVIRKSNEKISDGFSLPVTSEKDVFEHLDLNYLEPHERER